MLLGRYVGCKISPRFCSAAEGERAGKRKKALRSTDLWDSPPSYTERGSLPARIAREVAMLKVTAAQPPTGLGCWWASFHLYNRLSRSLLHIWDQSAAPPFFYCRRRRRRRGWRYIRAYAVWTEGGGRIRWSDAILWLDVQSSVTIFLLRSENHSQNVPLPTPKLH